jgi:hypothetical protein
MMKKIGSRLAAALLLALLAVLLPGTGATASAEEGESLTVDNGIPVIYLRVDESRGTIADMISSPDHSAYCYGTLDVTVPEGFHYSDFPELSCQSLQGLEMSLRGRGNSTWVMGAKKPFKIKLDKKADLFGLGKNKHWVLVANDFDESLLKDRITAWLGDALGFPFTPRGVPVDLILIGDEYGERYLGSYYLSENVRVDDNRVAVAELDEDDTDPAVITGGYLLQDAVQLRPGSPDRFFTSRGVDWGTHTPSFDTEADQAFLTAGEEEEGEEAFAGAELADAYKNDPQQQYIQDYMQMVEDVLFDGTTAYRELFDMEIAAKYWLINEVSLNADAFSTGSTYIYKDRDTGDGPAKLFWGPLWDFDFAWNHRVTTSGLPAGHKWTKAMLYDRAEGGFVEELHKQWPALRSALLELIADGGVIDRYCAETRASAEADWAIYHPDTEFDYPRAVEELKEWIRERIAWLDDNFSMVDELVYRVTFLSDGEVYDRDYLSREDPFRPESYRAEKEGYFFLGWDDADGNPIESEIWPEGDLTVTARYIPDSEVTHATDVAFPKDCDMIRYNAFFNSYFVQYRVIPDDATDKYHTWTSSDETVATIDNNGMVETYGTGTVTFTVTLSSGKSRTFTLIILEDGVIPGAETMFPEREVIRLKVGEQSPCPVSTTPSPARLNWYAYASEDESVAAVLDDYVGVIQAVGPGQTRIRITAGTSGADGKEITLETYATVIVTEEEPIAYTVTADSPSVWTKGSREGITLTVKRSEADETCFDHFTGVKLDGALLEKGWDYTARAGSTVVTIPAETLEKLSAGAHKVVVCFDDGEAEAALEIKDAESAPDSPPTGDRMITVWGALMAAGCAGIVLTRAYRRRSDGGR